MDYFKKIREIVADQLSIDAETITLATSFNDLDADSLDVVEVIMALEDEFGIAIPDEVAEKMKDIGAVVDYVSENAK
ncbi:MAG: acyl carrier protein [Peptococcaceae bacterium]|nr:acyl carrier protein [Peptococcaceae bacterium]